MTTLPVLGVPVATNAGLLAAQILAIEDEQLAKQLEALRARQTASVPEAPQDDA
jgi:5-(carboxyamino)imidazole ribonucleotide mutase